MKRPSEPFSFVDKEKEEAFDKIVKGILQVLKQHKENNSTYAATI
jgi:hypothetical protein